MKKLFISAVLILFVSAQTVISQNLGVSYGTGTFSNFEEVSVPKHLTGHLQYPVGNLVLGGSVGIGMAQNVQEYKYLDEDYTYTYSTFGIPIEGEVLFVKPFSEGSEVKFFLGIGAGFYHYKNKVKSENGGESETSDISKCSGLAQYFTFGLDVGITDNFSSFLQFKKLGFSLIKTEFKEDGYYEDYKTSYVAYPGFLDIGIALGVRFNLQ